MSHNHENHTHVHGNNCGHARISSMAIMSISCMMGICTIKLKQVSSKSIRSMLTQQILSPVPVVTAL